MAERPKHAGALLTAPLLLLLLGCFAAPILLMAPVSLHPYVPGQGISTGWTLDNYTNVLTDGFYIEVLGRTAGLGFGTTALCLLIGYPLAYAIARARGNTATWLTLAVLFPMLVNLVVRSFGWITLLANRGVINLALMNLGVIDRPIRLLFNFTGLLIGMTHLLLPFMVLILASALRGLPRDVEAASAALGASPLKTFFLVTLPLTAPAMFVASVLVFVLSISALVTPRLLGGPTYKVMATLIYDEFMATLNWPSGAALAFVLAAITLAVVGGAGLLTRRWGGAR
jgi:putative spermidine/putrescine transport system permease protein